VSLATPFREGGEIGKKQLALILKKLTIAEYINYDCELITPRMR
jgi:hypothetical protein